MADIIIDHICKSFDGRPVLTDVCLAFAEGQVSAIAAPSGAGKTTLIRIILGLEAPDSGAVRGLEGARLGAVFQEDRLLMDADAIENLRLVCPKLTREAAARALARFGLDDLAGKPAKQLSGGMRRRVALMRALMSDADVLVLDEPFNGLDTATRDSVIAQTLNLLRGRTAIVAAHDPEALRLLGARVFALSGSNDIEQRSGL